MQRERVILGECRPDQRSQLLLVLGAGDDHARQLQLGREREHALVARAVLADEAGPIDGDHDRQVVLADVVDFLVEGPLQEGRVEGHHGPLAGQGHARREGHGMLLGDADVDEPVRELGLEEMQARCRWACPP